MSNRTDRFLVVTGGPGAGKTTLIEALRAKGFAASIEAGRAIIQDQSAIDGPALPWADPGLFAELMLSWEMRSYRNALSEPGTVFFDRGLPELVGYFRLMGLPLPAHVRAAAEQFRYNRRVFIAPPWPEIFTQDSERKQTPEEAERTHDAVADAYAELGYELVPLPKASVEARLHFVLASIHV
jgi:predicted ATPase